MNLNTAKVKFFENGIKLERLYKCFMSDFSIPHQEACKEFLNRDISHHEFYCDMKRLQTLEVGDFAFVIYGSNLVTGGGFQTEVKFSDTIDEVINLFGNDFLETVLVFELTHHSEPFSAPAGSVYKLIK
jgi:hypothetical protein